MHFGCVGGICLVWFGVGLNWIEDGDCGLDEGFGSERLGFL